MAKKSTLKHKKALARRLRKRAKQTPIITDLGEYLQEFLLRGIYLFSLKQGQKAIQSATTQIHALLQEKKYAKIISLLGLDKIPRERAQILAYQALATHDREQAEKYIKQALRLDPNNVDALSWQANQIFLSDKNQPEQALTKMRKITTFAEKQLGPQLQTLSGRIHEFPLARPYLRSLNMLFNCLKSNGQGKEALLIGQKLLTLCASDIFNIRERIKQIEAHNRKSTSTQNRISQENQDTPSKKTVEEINYYERLNEKQRALFKEIFQKTDAFCLAYLNKKIGEYARRAAFLLCNEETSSMHRGKRESWASGIMHALAWANNLFNSDNPLSIQPVSIHTFFKISSSTTSKKSALIRKTLHITKDNADWLYTDQHTGIS